MMNAAGNDAIFRDLYDSEINYSISCFWDCGWAVKLGDALNGWAAEARCDSWDEAAQFLRDAAISAYPDSSFAKKHRSGFEPTHLLTGHA
jgi:squalene cyclase